MPLKWQKAQKLTPLQRGAAKVSLGFDDELESYPGHTAAAHCPDRPSQLRQKSTTIFSDTLAAPLCSIESNKIGMRLDRDSKPDP